MASIKKTSVDTRSQIIDTALQLFSERGYFNTSVHDIKKSAGISIGSIYHHFPSKEAIARALYEDLLHKMQNLIEIVSKQHESAHDCCKEVVRQLFIMTEYDPQAVQFVLLGKHQEYLPESPAVCSSRPFEMLREMVAVGMADGEIRGNDPAIAASCLFGGPLRMISLRLDGVIEKALPEQLEEVWNYSWKAVAI